MASNSLIVVGGGASGIFAAIAAARSGCSSVTVLEATSRPLRKVLLSGGGRCNVLHRPGVYSPRDLALKHFPRGSRELIGPFSSRWTQQDTWDWFENEGVALKIEDDGRCFPVTDNSATIADALLDAARFAGVELILGARVESIEECKQKQENEDGLSREHLWTVSYTERRDGDDRRLKRVRRSDAVMLATGSAPAGYELARSLGLEVATPVPSLFSFRLPADTNPLAGLAGVSLRDVELGLLADGADGGDASTSDASARRSSTSTSSAKMTHPQRGPLLVTHRGISGPAALRLSSFAATDLAARAYRGTLALNLVPGEISSITDAVDALRAHRVTHGSRGFVHGGTSGAYPFAAQLPRRVWAALCDIALGDGLRSGGGGGGGGELAPRKKVRWGELRKAEEMKLCTSLVSLRLPFQGKDANKEEFVTCGGVELAQVHLKTMEAKCRKGLYFGGEVLNVDGVTGGFNFQACWTTGYVAGVAAAEGRTPE